MYSNFSQMLSIVQKHHIDCLISFMLKHIFSTWKMTFDYWTARSQTVRCPWWCQVIWSNTQRLSSSQTFVITIELHLSDCTNNQRCKWDTPSKVHHKNDSTGHLLSTKHHKRKLHTSIYQFLDEAFCHFSSLLSHPLISIQLHCLPSSSSATKAESHPLGAGVRPHLPTSEFVCVDELWTYSAGMFFLWWLQRPIQWLGSFLHAVTVTSLFEANFEEVVLYTSSTPISQ